MPIHSGRLLAPTIAIALLICGTRPAHADVMRLPDGFADSLVVGGLSEPLALAGIPGGPVPRTLFIEQRTARVRMLIGRQLAATDPVGIVPAVRSTENERGLLGVAVDPAWPARPYLYTWSSSSTGFMRLSRFTLNGDRAFTGNGELTMDPATRHDLIADAPDQAGNHNGGALHFGPDGMLYVSIGDDATGCAAQDTVSLRGVVLRLRVDALPDGPGSAARALITPGDNPFVSASSAANARLVWAIGFRNPFRFHIDPASGALFVADVGENNWEELSRVTAGTNAAWPWREGPASLRTCTGAQPPGLLAPIASFDHTQGAAIISLGVYRSSATGPAAFPAAYQGDVFYSDYYTGFVRRLRFDGLNWTSPVAPGQPNSTDWAQGGARVADARVGPDGALWYVRQFASGGGEISRIVRADSSVAPPPPPPPAGRATLGRPAPNPFSTESSFEFTVPRESSVRLVILDARGSRIRELLSRVVTPGSHPVLWDGRDETGIDAPAGIYFVQLTQDGVQIATRRLARVR